MFRASIILLAAALSTAALSTAAFAGAHIRTITHTDSGPIKQSDAYAKNGNLLIEERGFNISASASSEEVKVEAEPGEVNDTIIFHVKEQEILARERNSNTCQWLNANSKMPEGMMPGQAEMDQYQKQLAEMQKALAEAKSQMSEEERKIFEQHAGGLTGGGLPGAQPRDALSLVATGESKTINDFQTKGFRAETSGGDVRYMLWLTQIDSISGGREMKEALMGMVDFYESVLKGMGGGPLMENSMLNLLKSPEVSGLYLVRLEDRGKNEWSDVVYAKAGDVDVDFYPDCEKVDMM